MRRSPSNLTATTCREIPYRHRQRERIAAAPTPDVATVPPDLDGRALLAPIRSVAG